MSQTVQPITSGNMKDLGSALIQSIPTDLLDEDAAYWIGAKKKLHQEVRRILRRSGAGAEKMATAAPESPNGLTEEVKWIVIPAISRFSLDEWINAINPNGPIGFIDDLKEWSGLIEPDTLVTVAVFRRLTSQSQFGKAWNSLSNPVELSWGQIAWLIDNGHLRTDCWAELFRIGSSAVHIRRFDLGWMFSVSSFDDLYEWDAGCHVVSCNSEAPIF